MNDLAHLITDAKPKASQPKMGPMLVANGKLEQKDLNVILATQKKLGLRFGDAALTLGLVNADDVKAILAEQFAYTTTPGVNSLLDHRLTALFQPDGLQAEALRSLRSELLLRYFNTDTPSPLALVGSDDAESIALTSANLAISFAHMGFSTLLIDCNLRQPQLHQLFHLNPLAPGWSDSLAGRALLTPTAVKGAQSLQVVCAGTPAPNPQELLANRQQFHTQLNALSQGFDVVLLSTPPLTANIDAQLVAAHAGAALLLAKAHHTKTNTLAKISSRLQELGVRLLGVSLSS
jgi:protein-tyrosine kinase